MDSYWENYAEFEEYAIERDRRKKEYLARMRKIYPEFDILKDKTWDDLDPLPKVEDGDI